VLCTVVLCSLRFALCSLRLERGQNSIGGIHHVSREFGLFTEGCWQQHKMSHDRAVGGGDVDLVLRPWVWNVGFVFRG